MKAEMSVLETERLILREIEECDTDVIVQWRSDPGVYRYFKNPHKITTEEHLRWFRNNYIVSQTRFDWMCIEKKTGEKIGVFGLSKASDNSAEVNYILSKNAQHKGYASEAIKELCEYAKAKFNTHEILAEIHFKNTSSIKLVEKSGFKKRSIDNEFITYSKNVSNKIIIRADANSSIGSGHVMRCLSVAKAFEAAGKECVFVTADHNSDIIIERSGIKHFCLDTVWNDLDTEINVFTDFINEYSPKIVLIDSYFVTQKYLKAISDLSYTVYMDDMADECRPVDVLVNYNVFALRADYSRYAETDTKLLLGPAYTPLRSEFDGIAPHEIKDTVSDIFISAGGSDPQNISEKIMREICTRSEWQQTVFHFIIGALNPRIENLRLLQKDMGNIVLHINEKNMSKLMCKCDIAVSAAGSTLYELCACGTPAITYTLADNQTPAADMFSALGIMLNAGDCRTAPDFIGALDDLLTNLAKNKETRLKMSAEMQKFADGRGAARLVNELLHIKTNSGSGSTACR